MEACHLVNNFVSKFVPEREVGEATCQLARPQCPRPAPFAESPSCHVAATPGAGVSRA